MLQVSRIAGDPKAASFPGPDDSGSTALGCQHGHRTWLDCGYPCGLWWYQGLQTSQTLIMVPGSSPGSDVSVAPGGSVGHLDHQGLCSRVALGHQHGPRWQPRTLTSAWSSIVPGATAIDLDPDCSRAIGTDRALGSNPDLDDTMAPGGSIGSQVPAWSGLRCHLGLRWQRRPL